MQSSHTQQIAYLSHGLQAMAYNKTYTQKY